MILDNIVKKTKERVDLLKKEKPLESLKEESKGCNKKKNFYEALKKDEMAFIMEVKRASPSKGVIAEDFNYLEIAKEYEKIGASAVSVLTEPYFFKGKNEYLQEISESINLPILRKDFIVDKYQIYESKLIGADGILLICAILEEKQLMEYLDLARKLKLDVLVETHNEKEIQMALKAKARIIGVNNRNLEDFTVDINNSVRLRKLVPKDLIYISESGIETRKDIQKLEENNIDAVLIGEFFMKAKNKNKVFNTIRGIK
ncbi:MAG: indole-3-glycerol phosphate synthase TrpC [Miniphocaeibacter sp.]|uniref:indole-3-glycerol phosphate synthase TrpC n=1 Tax=Miniphocaeibacter sp. TaxID=3100973 RepID=UPI001834E6AD|nr:indole-3-glycerol phosphate synthase TrpC [Gallicola sp.]